MLELIDEIERAVRELRETAQAVQNARRGTADDG
jgi:hypothetical protein